MDNNNYSQVGEDEPRSRGDLELQQQRQQRAVGEEEDDDYAGDAFEAPSPDGKTGNTILRDSPANSNNIRESRGSSPPPSLVLSGAAPTTPDAAESDALHSAPESHNNLIQNVDRDSVPSPAVIASSVPLPGGTYMRGKWIPAGVSAESSPLSGGSRDGAQAIQSNPSSAPQSNGSIPAKSGNALLEPPSEVIFTSRGHGTPEGTSDETRREEVSRGDDRMEASYHNGAYNDDDDYSDGYFDSPSKPATARIGSAAVSADGMRTPSPHLMVDSAASLTAHQTLLGTEAEDYKDAPLDRDTPLSGSLHQNETRNGPSLSDTPIRNSVIPSSSHDGSGRDGGFYDSEAVQPSTTSFSAGTSPQVMAEASSGLMIPPHLSDLPSRPEAAPSGEVVFAAASDAPQGRSGVKRSNQNYGDDDCDVFGGAGSAPDHPESKSHRNSANTAFSSPEDFQSGMQSGEKVRFRYDDPYEESYEAQFEAEADMQAASRGASVQGNRSNRRPASEYEDVSPSNSLKPLLSSPSPSSRGSARKTPEVLRRSRAVRSAKSGGSRRTEDSYNSDDFEDFEEYEEALEEEEAVIETMLETHKPMDEEEVVEIMHDADKETEARPSSVKGEDSREKDDSKNFVEVVESQSTPSQEPLLETQSHASVDTNLLVDEAKNENLHSGPESPTLLSNSIPFSQRLKEKKQRFAAELNEHQRSRNSRGLSRGRRDGDEYLEFNIKPSSRQSIPQAARRASTVDPEILKLQRRIEIIKYGKKSAAQVKKANDDVVDEVRNKLVRELEDAKRKYIEYCRNVGHPDGRVGLELREMGLSGAVNSNCAEPPLSPLRRPRVPMSTGRSAGGSRPRSDRDRSASPKKPWGSAVSRPMPPGRVIVHNSRALAVSSGLNFGALSLHDESSFATASDVEDCVEVPPDLESGSNVDLARLPVFFALDKPRSVYRRPKKTKGSHQSVNLTPSKKPPQVRNSRFVVAPSSWLQPQAASKMALYSALANPSQQSQWLDDGSQFVDDSSIDASLRHGDPSIDMYLPAHVASISLTPSLLQEQMQSVSQMYRMGRPVSLIDGESAVDGGVRDGHAERMHQLISILKPDAPIPQRVVVRRPKVTKPKSRVKKKRMNVEDPKPPPNPLSEREEKERQIRELRISIAKQSLSPSEFELRERKRRELEERRLNFFENLEAKKKIEREQRDAEKAERERLESKRRQERGEFWAIPSVYSSDGISENSPSNGRKSRRAKTDCGPFKRKTIASKGEKDKGSKKRDSDSDSDDISALLGLDLPKRKAEGGGSDDKSRRLMEAVAAAKAAALTNVPYDDKGPVDVSETPRSQPTIIMMNKSNPSPRLQKYAAGSNGAAYVSVGKVNKEREREGTSISFVASHDNAQSLDEKSASKANSIGRRSVADAPGKRSSDWVLNAVNGSSRLPNDSKDEEEDYDEEEGAIEQGGGQSVGGYPSYRSKYRKKSPQRQGQLRGDRRLGSGASATRPEATVTSRDGPSRTGPESIDTSNDSDSSFGSRVSHEQHRLAGSTYSQKSQRTALPSTPSIDEREVTPSGQFYHISSSGAPSTYMAAPPKQPVPSQRRQGSGGRSIRDPGSSAAPAESAETAASGRVATMSAGINIDGFYAAVAKRAAEGVPSGSAGAPATTADTDAFYRSIHDEFRQALK